MTTIDDRRLTKDAGKDGPSSIVHRHSLAEDPLAPTVQLDLNLPARIPESYVPEAALRLQLYRRLAGLTALDAVDELAHEFADRFGPTPEEVRNLLFVVQIKVLAINAGVEAIGFEEGQLLIKCAALETTDRATLQERLKSQGVSARVARRAIWLEMREGREWREDLVKTLGTMCG